MPTSPRGAPELVSGQAIPETTVNEIVRHVEAGACHFPVADQVTGPPGSCDDGANYLIIATATGAFATKENQIATALGTNAANGWRYHVPIEGFTAYVQDENEHYLFSGSAWGIDSSAGLTETEITDIVQNYLAANGGSGSTPVGGGGGSTYTFPTSDEWRVLTVTAGPGAQSGWSHITFFDVNGAPSNGPTTGFSYPTNGTGSASSEETGYEAPNAFDTNSETRWRVDLGVEAAVGSWIQFTFDTPRQIHKVRLFPDVNNLDYAPTEWDIEYWNGSAWVAVGTGTNAWATSAYVETAVTGAVVTPPATGGGTYTGPIEVPDDPYDATGWNGNLEVPTKNAVRDKIEALAGSIPGAGASTTQTKECIAGFIASPANKDYRLVVKIPHGGTITETTTRSVSGTCTATFKVNTTALGGTANSVSSSEQSQAHASTNTFAADDDIVLTVSSNSSCVDMSFSIKYTRALD